MADPCEITATIVERETVTATITEIDQVIATIECSNALCLITISKLGEPQLTGHVTLSEGQSIILTQVGQNIEIAVADHAPRHGDAGGDEFIDIGPVPPAATFAGMWWVDTS